jgi:DNA invertase Pin-like site-specific DNA recombinase
MAHARRGLFDVVVVWRFDRFARSVKQLVLALDEFHAPRIDFVSQQESPGHQRAMGKFMYTIIAAMAKLERAVTLERFPIHPQQPRVRMAESPSLKPSKNNSASS